MAEEKYTWDDIIINPTSQEAKNAVGKEVYYGDSPTETLDNAIKNRNAVILDSIELKENMPFKVYLGFEGLFLFSCIIVKKEESYEEREKKFIEENDLKVGDYVKVLRKAESHANGWNAEWVSAMDNWVGKTLKVMAISPIDSSIILECNDVAYSFPYFVLEKAEPPKPKYVPFKSVEEFLDGYYKSETERVKDGLEHYLSTRGIWIRYKITGFSYQITMLGTTTVIVNTDQLTDFKELLEKYEFLDGSPCGKEVKDEF